MPKIETLLSDEFDIDVSDYFTLNEKQKQEITRIIVSQYLKTLSVNPTLAPEYTFYLGVQLDYAVEHEDFEKADMIERVIKKIEELFGKIK